MRRTNRALALATLIALVLPVGAAASGETAESSDPMPVEVRPGDPVEPLRLVCRNVGGQEGLAVGCRWSAPTSDDAVGVRLVRVDRTEAPRQTVFRTDDLTTTTFVDPGVRAGMSYGYVVQALDASGAQVARSRLERVHVPARLEAIDLDCRLGPAGEAIGCRWSTPQHPAASKATLWRSVDGGPREVVAEYRADGPTVHRDPVPDGASHVASAVVVTSESGKIVGRSRAAEVRIPVAG